MAFLIHTRLKILKEKENERFPTEGYNVKFYDRDLLRDDFLGEVRIFKPEEEIVVSVKPADFSNENWSPEACPDIYFEVFRRDELLYKSQVYKNIQWIVKTDDTGKRNLVYELGEITV